MEINRTLFIRRVIAVTVLCLLILLAVFCGYLLRHNKNAGKSGAAALNSTDTARQRSWCIVKPGTPDNTLYENINYACTYTDCTVIQEGGICFLPQDKRSYASVAMNLYYKSEGENDWNCDFSGTGLITYSDPSYGSCKFA